MCHLAAPKRGRPKVLDWLQLTFKFVFACISLVVMCISGIDEKNTIRIAFVAFRISLGLVDFPGKVHRYTEYLVFLVQFVILILNSLGRYLESGGFCTRRGNEM